MLGTFTPASFSIATALPHPKSFSTHKSTFDPNASALKVTMDTYVQAISDEKRKAQSKVVELIMPGIRKKAGR